MCWRHFRGSMVATTFALILAVACRQPAAADCRERREPRGRWGDIDGDTDLSDLGILLADWGCTP